MEVTQPLPEVHSPNCKRRGFRYVSTIVTTPETIANKTAGRVVMICKTCPVRRMV